MQRTSASVVACCTGWRPEEDGGGTGSQSLPSLRHSTSGPRKCGDGIDRGRLSVPALDAEGLRTQILILVISVTFQGIWRQVVGRPLNYGRLCLLTIMSFRRATRTCFFTEGEAIEAERWRCARTTAPIFNAKSQTKRTIERSS